MPEGRQGASRDKEIAPRFPREGQPPRGAYKAPREDIARVLEGLLRSTELIVENAEAAYRALSVYMASSSADFADALITETASLAGASETVTFDRNAAKGAGMRLLK